MLLNIKNMWEPARGVAGAAAAKKFYSGRLSRPELTLVTSSVTPGRERGEGGDPPGVTPHFLTDAYIQYVRAYYCMKRSGQHM